MDHWCEQYIGQPWTPECDCFGWFRLWRERHFADLVPDVAVNDRHLPHVAMALMTPENGMALGWEQTSAPVEGDAVLLSRGERPHHIGMVVFIGCQMRVLHALEGGRVTRSTNIDLLVNGWKTKEYWAPCK